MNFKGPRKIPLMNSFVKILPAIFGISRDEWANPIGNGLVRGAHFETIC